MLTGFRSPRAGFDANDAFGADVDPSLRDGDEGDG